jgi:Arc/MetJ family transcription regulator
MRTTLDVDPKLIAEAERLTGEASASKAVNAALKEFVRKRKLKELRAMLGTMELEDNWREMEEKELEDMRRNQR